MLLLLSFAAFAASLINVYSPSRAAAATPTKIGKTSVGTRSDAGFAANVKRVNAYTLQTGGTIASLSIYLQPTSARGTQHLTGVIYKDDMGAPGKLVGTSNPISFSNRKARGWYSLPMVRPASVPAGKYWIGVVTGKNGGVAGYRWHRVSRARSLNANNYAAGPSTRFGAHSTDNEQMSLYANYVPSASVAAVRRRKPRPPASTHTTQTSTSTTQTSTPTVPTVNCTFYASPTGSRAGSGGQGSPYDLQTMLNKLTPGQTGCLLSGSFGSTPDNTGMTPSTGTHWTFPNSGTSSQPITVTAAPGDSSTPVIVGWVDIYGAYWTLSHLAIDDSNTYYSTANSSDPCQSGTVPYKAQSIAVEGSGVVFDHDDIYTSMPNLRGVLLGIGFGNYHPVGVTVRYSLLHEAGGHCYQHEHAIYLASGSDTQIYNNWIWNSHGGQAIILYPSPSGSHVYDNVIDGSDSGMGVTTTGTGNKLDHNIVSNSGQMLYDGGGSMAGVFVNCGGTQSGGNTTLSYDVSYNNPGGFTDGCGTGGNWPLLSNTSTANPQYVAAASHDFAVQAGSAFASWGLPRADQMGPQGS